MDTNDVILAPADNNETVYDDTDQKKFFKELKPIQWGGEYFKRLKTSKLPPSLDKALSTFYEYSMKMLIKDIITIIAPIGQPLQNPILVRVNKLRDNLGFKIIDVFEKNVAPYLDSFISKSIFYSFSTSFLL